MLYFILQSLRYCRWNQLKLLLKKYGIHTINYRYKQNCPILFHKQQDKLRWLSHKFSNEWDKKNAYSSLCRTIENTKDIHRRMLKHDFSVRIGSYSFQFEIVICRFITLKRGILSYCSFLSKFQKLNPAIIFLWIIPRIKINQTFGHRPKKRCFDMIKVSMCTCAKLSERKKIK